MGALDEAAAEPIVKQAVDGGVIFFDTADVYNGDPAQPTFRMAGQRQVALVTLAARP